MTDKRKEALEAIESYLDDMENIIWDEGIIRVVHKYRREIIEALQQPVEGCKHCGGKPNVMHEHDQENLPKIYWCDCESNKDLDYMQFEEWNKYNQQPDYKAMCEEMAAVVTNELTAVDNKIKQFNLRYPFPSCTPEMMHPDLIRSQSKQRFLSEIDSKYQAMKGGE